MESQTLSDLICCSKCQGKLILKDSNELSSLILCSICKTEFTLKNNISILLERK